MTSAFNYSSLLDFFAKIALVDIVRVSAPHFSARKVACCWSYRIFKFSHNCALKCVFVFVHLTIALFFFDLKCSLHFRESMNVITLRYTKAALSNVLVVSFCYHPMAFDSCQKCVCVCAISAPLVLSPLSHATSFSSALLLKLCFLYALPHTYTASVSIPQNFNCHEIYLLWAPHAVIVTYPLISFSSSVSCFIVFFVV